MTARRTTAPLLALALALLLLVLGGAGQAGAVGYRYWSFWDLTGGKWTYATQGPSTARPSDGDVQGFRFAVSEDSQHAVQPRGEREFAAICAKTPARQGKKRVALVIDPGTAADAPSGERPPSARTACAQVAPDASTAEALAAVAGPPALRHQRPAVRHHGLSADGLRRPGRGRMDRPRPPARTPPHRPGRALRWACWRERPRWPCWVRRPSGRPVGAGARRRS